MFWVLFLAHLIADYPLQPDRLVAAKKRLPGLTIHVLVHWGVMTLMTWPVRAVIWPYVLVVTIFHFIIDYFKVLVGFKKPEWVIGPYLWDQPLHWLSLIIVCYWLDQTTDLSVWQVLSPWIVYGIGGLMVTHIWFVTERVLTHRDLNLQLNVINSMWPRMAARLILFILMMIARPLSLLILIIVISGLFIYYRRNNYSLNTLAIDIVVALVSSLFAFVILTLF